MSNLIDNVTKTAAQNAMKDVFDTFKRTEPLSFYKKESDVIVMKDPNFRANWGLDYSNFDTEFTQTTQTGVFSARVWYGNYQPVNYSFKGEDNLQVKTQHVWGEIKIQVEEDGYLFLKESERVEFLGEQYRLKDDVRRIGILGEFQFYEFRLEKVS